MSTHWLEFLGVAVLLAALALAGNVVASLIRQKIHVTDTRTVIMIVVLFVVASVAVTVYQAAGSRGVAQGGVTPSTEGHRSSGSATPSSSDQSVSPSPQAEVLRFPAIVAGSWEGWLKKDREDVVWAMGVTIRTGDSTAAAIGGVTW